MLKSNSSVNHISELSPIFQLESPLDNETVEIIRRFFLALALILFYETNRSLIEKR